MLPLELRSFFKGYVLKMLTHGIADILVDGTLLTANKQFAKAEERMHINYDMGQTHIIANGSQTKFGGAQIGRDPNGTLRISHHAYNKNPVKYQGKYTQRYRFCTHSERQSVLDRYMDPYRCNLRHGKN
jgi:hypothetical protein